MEEIKGSRNRKDENEFDDDDEHVRKINKYFENHKSLLNAENYHFHF